MKTSTCVAIGVVDAVAASTHFRDVLGWEIGQRGDGWIEMKSGALRIFFCADDETTPTFDLEVQDIEAAKAHLESAGWTVSPLSKKEIYMVSPFGTAFALSPIVD